MSQTDDVTTYTIKGRGFILNLIDTPGFADTRGPKQDEKITEGIRTHFLTKMSCLD